MTGKGLTKDERFMVRLYEEAMKKGEYDEPQDRYAVGQLVGLQKTAVDTICNLLAQANFIKKKGPAEIALTAHGVNLVKDLLEP